MSMYRNILSIAKLCIFKGKNHVKNSFILLMNPSQIKILPDLVARL